MSQRFTAFAFSIALLLSLPFAAGAQTPAAKAAKTTPMLTGDIKQIDVEGLKKLLQRGPKDTQPLLINFWATWCDGCREEFPDLVKIDKDYHPKGLKFVAISLDEIEDIQTKVVPFIAEMKAEMPVVVLKRTNDEEAIHAVDPNWQGDMPATYLFDKDGKVLFKYFGRIKTDELRAALDKAVSSKKQ